MYDKFTCFYPIFALPPSVYHYNTAILLAQRENIGSVIVIIPDLKYPYLDQHQSFKLMQLYGTGNQNIDIRIEMSSYKNAFQDIKERFQKDPNLAGYIAIDEDTAKSNEFNKAFADFDNIEPELIHANFEDASKAMREAIEKGDKKEFMRYIPDTLTAEHKEDCWRVVHNEVEEQITDKNFWKKVILEGIDSCDFFNVSTTGMPPYDAMIKNPSYYFFFKDQTISLQYMTAEEYMKLCGADVHDVPTKDEYESIDIPDVKALIKLIQDGVKLDTPVLNLEAKSQEGRHRSIAARSQGCDSIPVYVVSKAFPGKQKAATEIIKKAIDYDTAKADLAAMGVPLDEKTFQKVQWKEFKLNTEKSMKESVGQKNYDKSRKDMIAFIDKQLNLIRDEALEDAGRIFHYQTFLYSAKDKISKERY